LFNCTIYIQGSSKCIFSLCSYVKCFSLLLIDLCFSLLQINIELNNEYMIYCLCIGFGSSTSYDCSPIRQQDLGKRIHANARQQMSDCKDRSRGNTCRGGQTTALIECKCSNNCRSAPASNCWKAGAKVLVSKKM